MLSTHDNRSNAAYHRPIEANPDIEGLWRRYKAAQLIDALIAAGGGAATPSAARIADRNALAEHYHSMVEPVARKVSVPVRRQGEMTEREDLVSYGYFGLLDAIDKFTPEGSISVSNRFQTFAAERIRGAILDEMRSVAWVGRTLKDRVRAVSAARARLEHRLHRTPTVAELAGESGLEVRWVIEGLKDGEHLEADSFDVMDEEFGRLAEPAEENSDPGLGTDVSQLRWDLARAIAALPERERVLLALHYREHLSLEEVGEVMGIRTTRASQIQTAAVRHLAMSVDVGAA